MPKVRGLRTIKKEILKLIQIFVEKADDTDMINTNIVPPLLDAVLVDYNRNVPDARDAEVLDVMTTIITKLNVRWTRHSSKYSVRMLEKDQTSKLTYLQGLMTDKVPTIMENIFECTLEMINKDFSEYPQHRVEFFKLLKAINLYCFPALLKLDGRQFKFVIDSCMWASKHDNREVENTGLTMCIELMDNMAEQADPQTSAGFFQQFFVNILQDVFFVLTDSDHKAGFKNQTQLLSRMFWFVETGRITQPVYAQDQAPSGTSNKQFLTEFIKNLLQTAFPNLQPVQISTFIDGLFSLNHDQARFKLNIRDFLVQLKEFSGDNAELYAEDREVAQKAAKDAERERASKVGGLLKPSEIDQDDEL